MKTEIRESKPYPEGWNVCTQCKAYAHGIGLYGKCHDCHASEGQAWRKAKERGEHNGVISGATWKR
jgi:hypothetical protein